MKIRTQWLENGQEVDLPEMKVEGSLAVAELTKKHADEFLPFILAIQEEATVRARIDALIGGIKDKPTDDELTQTKAVLRMYDVEHTDKNIKAKSNELLDKLGKKLDEASKEAAHASIVSTPFFLERSLLEAYYMIKAYYRQKAIENGEKPRMPFTKDDLRELMDDAELALFTKHTTSKMKQEATEPQTAEQIKKK